MRKSRHGAVNTWLNCSFFTLIFIYGKLAIRVVEFWFDDDADDDDVQKYSFTQRIVNFIWYSLPKHVVNSSSANSFKNNLDKFWVSQEVYYNFKCDITGTGNKSLCQLEWYVIVIKCDTKRRTNRLPSLRFSTPIRYDWLWRWPLTESLDSTLNKKAVLYRKDDRVMCSGWPENFLDSLTMSTATFPKKTFHGLLFWSTQLWIMNARTKFEVCIAYPLR